MSTNLNISLKSNKYDNAEILKAIDVVVEELSPTIPNIDTDYVSKEKYDFEVNKTKLLNRDLQILNINLENLNSQIINLESQIINEKNNKLSLDQSNISLKEQIDILKTNIVQFKKQVEEILQKSFKEVTIRASLSAENFGYNKILEMLLQHITALNIIIESLNSQVAVIQEKKITEDSAKAEASKNGADIINSICLFKFNTNNSNYVEDVVCKINGKLNDPVQIPNKGWLDGGPSMTIVNKDKEPIKVWFTHDPNIKKTTNIRIMDWFKIDYGAGKGYRLPNGVDAFLTLDPGESRTVYMLHVSPDVGELRNATPTGRNDKTANYFGFFQVHCRRANGYQESGKLYETRYIKTHYNSFNDYN